MDSFPCPHVIPGFFSELRAGIRNPLALYWQIMSATLSNTAADAVASSLSDAELVDRFVAVRDPAAFAELVFRHRALVLGVSARVLRNGCDIEDVFQATFLVLVRDAARVRKQQSLASWLYGVAHRLSLRAARQTRKRREIRHVEHDTGDSDVLRDLASRHDLQLLDAELNGLPEQYRIPLVLRYLAGRPPREIAQELAITPGALDGLLKRGKDELRVRLMRRGVTLGATLLAIQVSQHGASAADTLPLVDSTIKAGLAWQNGFNTSADLMPPRALELSGKELATMTTLTKASLAIVATLGVAAACVGTPYAVGQDESANIGRASDAGAISTVITGENEPTPAIVVAQGPKPLQLPKPGAGATGVGEPQPAATKPAGPVDSSALAKVPASPAADAPVAQAKTPRAAGKRWDSKARSPLVTRIESTLEQETEVSFTDNPLEEVLHYLKELHQLEILLDRQALQDEGVATDQQISLKMAGISLKSALPMILEPHGLDYLIKNEVLVITTAAKAREHFETRVYDISRLKGVTPAELDQIIRSTIAPDTWTPVERTEQLHLTAPAIKAPVATPTASAAAAPTAGMGGGGSRDLAAEGNIRSTKTSLVIRQTQHIHDEIVDLLNQLDAVTHTESAVTPTLAPTTPVLLKY